MNTNHNELLVLKIRSLIADKEMVTAQANRDMTCGDGWRTDYAAWHGQLDVEIQSLLDQASSKHNEMKDEIEQLNIAGATAVEAAKIFKQRAEKSEVDNQKLRELLNRAIEASEDALEENDYQKRRIADEISSIRKEYETLNTTDK